MLNNVLMVMCWFLCLYNWLIVFVCFVDSNLHQKAAYAYGN